MADLARTAALFALAALGACGHEPPRPEGEPPADPVADVPPEELFGRGLQLADRGDLVRAEQYVATAIERGYPQETALPVLLRICIAASRLRAALDYAGPYLERNPDAWALRFVVASIHLGMGDGVRARRDLEQVISVAPDAPDPHYLLAVVLRDHAADLPAARAEFERYVALAPDGAHAREAQNAVRLLAGAAVVAEADAGATP